MYSIAYMKALQFCTRFNSGLLEKDEKAALNLHTLKLTLLEKKECEIRRHLTQTDNPVNYLVTPERLLESDLYSNTYSIDDIITLSMTKAEQIILSTVYEKYQCAKLPYGVKEIYFFARVYKLATEYLDSKPNQKSIINEIWFELAKDVRKKFSKPYQLVFLTYFEQQSSIKFL